MAHGHGPGYQLLSHDSTRLIDQQRHQSYLPSQQTFRKGYPDNSLNKPSVAYSYPAGLAYRLRCREMQVEEDDDGYSSHGGTSSDTSSISEQVRDVIIEGNENDNNIRSCLKSDNPVYSSTRVCLGAGLSTISECDMSSGVAFDDSHSSSKYDYHTNTYSHFDTPSETLSHNCGYNTSKDNIIVDTNTHQIAVQQTQNCENKIDENLARKPRQNVNQNKGTDDNKDVRLGRDWIRGSNIRADDTVQGFVDIRHDGLNFDNNRVVNGCVQTLNDNEIPSLCRDISKPHVGIQCASEDVQGNRVVSDVIYGTPLDIPDRNIDNPLCKQNSGIPYKITDTLSKDKSGKYKSELEDKNSTHSLSSGVTTINKENTDLTKEPSSASLNVYSGLITNKADFNYKNADSSSSDSVNSRVQFAKIGSENNMATVMQQNLQSQNYHANDQPTLEQVSASVITEDEKSHALRKLETTLARRNAIKRQSSESGGEEDEEDEVGSDDSLKSEDEDDVAFYYDPDYYNEVNEIIKGTRVEVISIPGPPLKSLLKPRNAPSKNIPGQTRIRFSFPDEPKKKSVFETLFGNKAPTKEKQTKKSAMEQLFGNDSDTTKTKKAEVSSSGQADEEWPEVHKPAQDRKLQEVSHPIENHDTNRQNRIFHPQSNNGSQTATVGSQHFHPSVEGSQNNRQYSKNSNNAGHHHNANHNTNIKNNVAGNPYGGTTANNVRQGMGPAYSVAPIQPPNQSTIKQQRHTIQINQPKQSPHSPNKIGDSLYVRHDQLPHNNNQRQSSSPQPNNNNIYKRVDVPLSDTIESTRRTERSGSFKRYDKHDDVEFDNKKFTKSLISKTWRPTGMRTDPSRLGYNLSAYYKSVMSQASHKLSSGNKSNSLAQPATNPPVSYSATSPNSRHTHQSRQHNPNVNPHTNTPPYQQRNISAKSNQTRQSENLSPKGTNVPVGQQQVSQNNQVKSGDHKYGLQVGVQGQRVSLTYNNFSQDEINKLDTPMPRTDGERRSPVPDGNMPYYRNPPHMNQQGNPNVGTKSRNAHPIHSDTSQKVRTLPANTNYDQTYSNRNQKSGTLPSNTRADNYKPNQPANYAKPSNVKLLKSTDLDFLLSGGPASSDTGSTYSDYGSLPYHTRTNSDELVSYNMETQRTHHASLDNITPGSRLAPPKGLPKAPSTGRIDQSKNKGFASSQDIYQRLYEKRTRVQDQKQYTQRSHNPGNT